MTMYVFTGPTLPVAEARAELDAIYLPPAAQGDVYRVALERPSAIGIIDGYFERVPSIWHKEILWALSQGIAVFGASSMGALRASELSVFGMVGVGDIFESFHRGELEDDDEVAVVHGPGEDGFRPLSEAMVNVRATLKAAEAQGLIGPALHQTLVRVAKALFYPDRVWPRVLAGAAGEGASREALEALRGWLPGGRVDQKKRDALSLLRVMRAHLEAPPATSRPPPPFERTDAWVAMESRTERRTPGAPELAGAREDLLDELRLSGGFEQAWQGALGRALALELTRRMGRVVPPEVSRQTIEDFRRERGLFEGADLQRWLDSQRLERSESFFHDEALVRWVRTMFASDAERCLADHLRTTGALGALLARAEDKRRVLTTRCLEEPELSGVGLTEEALWRWYFEEHLRSAIPPDLERHARAAGFDSTALLRRAALREYVYSSERG
ncbi:hypothetical protein SAMN05443572_12023 [Myxococcus fulvus]|uniref:TfuA-like core domain-containing protein n=1 Tax=Myxococcus fulvus TaxID=33 RepID=A0A511TGW7_MYXFU|nr:TfuA-like protein [Myxococcus fulvus]GEN13391.1 hypothetical protein MFU01_84280 [Myxococcus fulvus]SEU42662.1 hypothetical protein SAMN05443572_12023 [Myxococcus fulvus]